MHIIEYLRISEKPNVALNCFSVVMLKEGDNFTCLCRGTVRNPPAKVTWFKDGVKFSDVGMRKQTLNLLNVGVTDHGTYKCVTQSFLYNHYTEMSIKVTVYCK